MNLVVLIKQVPETDNLTLDEETGTVRREGVENIMNPLDLYALEAALRVKEETGAPITALTMGPPSSRQALLEALAMGADHAVLLTDKAFAGSDTWATARILAAGIQRLSGFDLIFCGERATDGETGQTGPEVAAFLDIPLLAFVSRLRVSEESVRAERILETGIESLRCPLPAAVSVVKAIGRPRLPTLAGKQSARRADVTVWGHGELELDSDSIGLRGSPTRVKRVHKPQITRQARILKAESDEELEQAALQVIEYLNKAGL